MNKKYIFFIVLGLLVISLAVWGINSLWGNKGQGGIFSVKGSVIDEVKKEFGCTCGCGLSLNNCQTYDPDCPIRPGIISKAETLAQEGKTKDEIIDVLSGKTSDVSSVVDDEDPYLGSENAPVTIVEFSDFQCPFCANFYSQTFSKIKSEYIDTGKVKFVYKDFPLSFHQYAEKAAEAAECADDQGKFWEYQDLLFKRQSEWTSYGTDKFKQYASELGFNRQDFDSCLDDSLKAGEVQDDFADGNSKGVNGTPAFFINGELVSGAQPFEVFKQKIDSLLQ